jgi:hypothetical protein
MENMDKGLIVPKWVLNADKSAEDAPNALCPSPKFWDFDEKRIHWASVVRVST